MRIITIAIIVMVSQGCATMFNRTAQQRVLVTSTPPGAEVFIEGDPVGTTPTSVVVRDSDAPEIRLESDGQSRQVRLSRRMSPWLWADLPAGALTGLLGAVTFRCDECDLNYVAGVFTSMAPLIVDLVTGRALRLPSTISVTLAPAGSRRLDVPPWMVSPIRHHRARAPGHAVSKNPGPAGGGAESDLVALEELDQLDIELLDCRRETAPAPPPPRRRSPAAERSSLPRQRRPGRRRHRLGPHPRS